jgi:hypothetical protein
MDSNAAALRDVDLESYSAVELLRTSQMGNLNANFDAVTRVLSAREIRAAQAEAQLQAILFDAQRYVKAHEDLCFASLAEAEEDSARLRRVLEEEAPSILKSAVSKIHEVEKKQQGEASAHLDAVREKIQALRNKQEEDLSATVAMIVEETEAKLKKSFSKIQAQLN